MNPEDERVQNLIAEQAAEWFVARSEGALGPQQAREFMHWLRQSPRHVAEYLAVADVAMEVADAARADQVSLAQLLADDDRSALVALDGGVVDPERWSTPATRFRWLHRRRHCGTTGVRRKRRRTAAWAAAAVVVVIGVVFLARAWMLPQTTVQSYATRHGQTRSVRLSDKTLVQLDTDSAIVVRYGPDRRRVSVERGRAYFDVAKDTGRPFSVVVGQSVVRDIGTAFDVFKHADSATVTVAHGRVGIWHVRHSSTNDDGWLAWIQSFRDDAGDPVAQLGVGQQVKITNAGQVAWLGTVDVDETLAWRRGKIVFDREGVGVVAAKFNRYNIRQIKVLDPRIAGLPISGTFDAHNMTAFVAFLRSLPDADVRDRGRNIVVDSEPPSDPYRR